MGNYQVVADLINIGVDVNAKINGKSLLEPLATTIPNGKHIEQYKKLISLLVKKEVDESELFSAMKCPSGNADQKHIVNSLFIQQFLLALPSDKKSSYRETHVTAINSDRKTLVIAFMLTSNNFHNACSMEQCIELLLSKGADPNELLYGGPECALVTYLTTKTIKKLSSTAESDNTQVHELFEILLERGIDWILFARLVVGSLLELKNCSSAILEYLLQANKEGLSERPSDELDLAHYLIRNSIKNACYTPQLITKTLMLLFNNGFPANVLLNGRNLLHCCAELPDETAAAVAKFVLTKVKGVSPECGDGTIGTPLHFAVKNAKDGLVNLFLNEKGANPRATDECGRTPFMCAELLTLEIKECKSVRDAKLMIIYRILKEENKLYLKRQVAAIPQQHYSSAGTKGENNAVQHDDSGSIKNNTNNSNPNLFGKT